MRKDMGRKLAEGITARLEFDFVCERGHSFGEYYLHGVMNEIISANIDPGVDVPHASYAHPALARAGAPAPGRKREVDFFIQPRVNGGPTACIEAKWAGSSHCTWEKVLLDLCRLTLVKNADPATECYFVLAGLSRDVNAVVAVLMRKMPLMKKPRRGMIRILQVPADNQHSRQRSYPLRDWANRSVIPKAVQAALPTSPVKIRSTLLMAPGMNTPRIQTIVWRID